MPTVIIPPTDVSPYTGTGNQVLATNPTFPGIITVSGGTATISGASGYLKLTSTSASKTWDLFADSGGSFYIAHSGVLNALQIAPTTGNATLAGDLTVSGTGTQQLGGSGAKLSVGTGYTGAGQINAYAMNGASINLYDDAFFSSIASVRNGSLSELSLRTQGGVERVRVTDTATNVLGNLTVSGAGTSTFAAPVAITSSGTSLVQLNLPFTSRIILGEGATNNANPAITMYRTTGGAAQGTAIRLYQPNSTGDFQIQKGTTDAPYGTETYTTHAQFTYNGNFIVGSVADNGNKLQVDGSAFIAGNLTNYNQRILRGPSSNSDATLVPVVAEFGKSSGNVGTTTATVVITGTVAASGAWREGMIEVYAATCNNYSGDEGGINELVTFQHDSSTGLNPRNFTVVRTNSAQSSIVITYAGTSPTTFTITVSRTDPSVPGTVPAHEVFAYVRVINSNAISLS